MASIQYHMMMTYYKVMKKVRKRVELDPIRLRLYMGIISSFNAPFVPRKVSQIKLGEVPTDKIDFLEDFPLILFFIHGGAFAFGSAKMHHAMASRLSQQLKAPAYIPAYRQAPEHAFPMPLNDCYHAYHELIRLYPDKKIVVIGDSAGGNLAASLCLKLTENKSKIPESLVLLSPWLDLDRNAESVLKNADDESLFDCNDLMAYAQLYVQGQDTTDPLVSPLRGNLSFMPRTLVQVAANELLYYDGLRFAEKLQENGVDVKLEVEQNLFHSWQLVPAFLPAAKRSLNNVASFIQAAQ